MSISSTTSGASGSLAQRVSCVSRAVSISTVASFPISDSASEIIVPTGGSMDVLTPPCIRLQCFSTLYSDFPAFPAVGNDVSSRDAYVDYLLENGLKLVYLGLEASLPT
ncbi:hypothetical protein GE061_001826 [Apolygus lucorum]|uniref:Uncharacterized protein n=1 Tax=Apolygus lucorum TaxID=248454 RepID=A0A8S9X7D3_APOLU|nr:hypothetical protein GE061_001826 [Apolygus lucorum]